MDSMVVGIPVQILVVRRRWGQAYAGETPALPGWISSPIAAATSSGEWVRRIDDNGAVGRLAAEDFDGRARVVVAALGGDDGDFGREFGAIDFAAVHQLGQTVLLGLCKEGLAPPSPRPSETGPPESETAVACGRGARGWRRCRGLITCPRAGRLT